MAKVIKNIVLQKKQGTNLFNHLPNQMKINLNRLTFKYIPMLCSLYQSYQNSKNVVIKSML